MKAIYKFFLYSLLIIFIFSGCKTAKNVNVISIGYHSDNCSDCNVLKSKMKVMNRKFFFEPIIFIKYDKTNDESQSAAELKLKKWDMLEISHRDDGLKYVILYSANTKEVLQRIIYSDSLETIESKIKLAIDQTENQFSSETHHK